MLLNFKILAFFWRQFYQEKGREWAKKSLKLPLKFSQTSVRKSRPQFEDKTEFNDAKSKAGRTVQRLPHLRTLERFCSGNEEWMYSNILSDLLYKDFISDKISFQRRLHTLKNVIIQEMKSEYIQTYYVTCYIKTCILDKISV